MQTQTAKLIDDRSEIDLFRKSEYMCELRLISPYIPALVSDFMLQYGRYNANNNPNNFSSKKALFLKDECSVWGGGISGFANNVIKTCDVYKVKKYTRYNNCELDLTEHGGFIVNPEFYEEAIKIKTVNDLENLIKTWGAYIPQRVYFGQAVLYEKYFRFEDDAQREREYLSDMNKNTKIAEKPGHECIQITKKFLSRSINCNAEPEFAFQQISDMCAVPSAWEILKMDLVPIYKILPFCLSCEIGRIDAMRGSQNKLKIITLDFCDEFF
jgi:hypothetical protein